jgi:hypothetical protein
MPRALPELPRAWLSVDLPGYRPHPREYTTYSCFAGDELPPVEADRFGDLRWMAQLPEHEHSIADPPDRDSPGGVMTTTRLRELLPDAEARLPATFLQFVASPALHRRVRSCTWCFLDLGDFVASTPDGGALVHVLSDSQWVAHWLLYAGPSGEAVVATLDPVGFEVEPEETVRVLDPERHEAGVCAESFAEFLYHLWIENEIWHAVRDGEPPLTDEQRRYAEHYRR